LSRDAPTVSMDTGRRRDEASMDVPKRDIMQHGWAVVGLFLIALVAALGYARAFLLPVLFAFMLALILRPVVRYLARRGIPEFLTSLGLVLSVLAAFGLGFYFLSAPLSALLTDLPRIANEIESKLVDFRTTSENIRAVTEKIENLGTQDKAGPSEVQKVEMAQPGLLSSVAANAPDAAARGLFALVLLLFLLSSGDLFYAKIVRAMPTFSDKKMALGIALDIERELSRYLGTITLINAGLGICVGAALWAIGIPNPILWGVLAGVLNFIPYIGSLIGVALVGTIALGTLPTLTHAALAPLAYFVLTTIEGQFVTPVLVGRRLALNPVTLFLGIAFWGWLWGVVGMLFAVPLMVAVKIFCSHIEGLATISDFLSTENNDDADEKTDEKPGGPTGISPERTGHPGRS
jgi:predicted PurR-regulated permease PerM